MTTHIIAFYLAAEKLKTTLRHSWLSNSTRQESVAEHSWMMALLAMVLIPQLKQQVDQEKVFKMIVLHDLAEAVTTDLPVWEGSKNKAEKYNAELAAMNQILGHLDEKTKIELMSIWEEYEERKTFEAKFVKAIDTLDVISQHNTAPIKTWDDNDYLWQISGLQDNFFNIDESLRKIKDEIDQWSLEKVDEVHNLDKLDQIELKKKPNKK